MTNEQMLILKLVVTIVARHAFEAIQHILNTKGNLQIRDTLHFFDPVTAWSTKFTLIRRRVPWPQIWIYSVCSDLSAPILRAVTVIVLYVYNNVAVYVSWNILSHL